MSDEKKRISNLIIDGSHTSDSASKYGNVIEKIDYKTAMRNLFQINSALMNINPIFLDFEGGKLGRSNSYIIPNMRYFVSMYDIVTDEHPKMEKVLHEMDSYLQGEIDKYPFGIKTFSEFQFIYKYVTKCTNRYKKVLNVVGNIKFTGVFYQKYLAQAMMDGLDLMSRSYKAFMVMRDKKDDSLPHFVYEHIFDKFMMNSPEFYRRMVISVVAGPCIIMFPGCDYAVFLKKNYAMVHFYNISDIIYPSTQLNIFLNSVEKIRKRINKFTETFQTKTKTKTIPVGIIKKRMRKLINIMIISGEMRVASLIKYAKIRSLLYYK